VVEALSVVELNSVEVGRIDDDAEDVDSDKVAETLAVEDADSTLEDEREGYPGMDAGGCQPGT
jgi:hypothetical protein